MWKKIAFVDKPNYHQTLQLFSALQGFLATFSEVIWFLIDYHQPWSGHREKESKRRGHILRHWALKLLLRAHQIKFIPMVWWICAQETQHNKAAFPRASWYPEVETLFLSFFPFSKDKCCSMNVLERLWNLNYTQAHPIQYNLSNCVRHGEVNVRMRVTV